MKLTIPNEVEKGGFTYMTSKNSAQAANNVYPCNNEFLMGSDGKRYDYDTEYTIPAGGLTLTQTYTNSESGNWANTISACQNS